MAFEIIADGELYESGPGPKEPIKKNQRFLITLGRRIQVRGVTDRRFVGFVTWGKEIGPGNQLNVRTGFAEFNIIFSRIFIVRW